jgi:hypothetical protein
MGVTLWHIAAQNANALRVQVGSLSRRGISHSNEDRMSLLDFKDLLSEETKSRILSRSTTGSVSKLYMPKHVPTHGTQPQTFQLKRKLCIPQRAN